MKGRLYGVGVGPGDPELMTLKAARLIKECAIIAVPDSGSGDQIALDIAKEHLAGKTVIHLPMPMTRDPAVLQQYRNQASEILCGHLGEGQDVVFLTLGDPTIYSTYLYIHRLVQQKDYYAELVAGVPSFCAAAAALDMPLCEGGEPLHIIPASYEGVAQALALDGVKVLMKSGKSIGRLIELLEEKGMVGRSAMVERVGLSGEKLTPDLSRLEGEPGYFCIVIAK